MLGRFQGRIFILRCLSLEQPLRCSSPSGQSHHKKNGTRVASQTLFKMWGQRLKNMQSQREPLHPFPSPLKSSLVDDDLDSWQEDGDTTTLLCLLRSLDTLSGVQRRWFRENLFLIHHTIQGMPFLKIRLAERRLKTNCMNPVSYSFLLFFFLLSPSLCLGLAALFPPF